MSSSTENVQNKCYYCGNTNQDTIEELGFDQKDTSFETDLWCKSCNTAFSTHYDCTQFRQVSDVDAFKKKYPKFAQEFKANEDAKRKLNKQQAGGNENQPQEVKQAELPSTETNKKDVERANQSEQEVIKAAQTNRPQQPDTQKPDNK